MVKYGHIHDVDTELAEQPAFLRQRCQRCGIRLSVPEERARVRIEGHDGSLLPRRARQFDRFADDGLMARVNAVEVADGHRLRQPVFRRPGLIGRVTQRDRDQGIAPAFPLNLRVGSSNEPNASSEFVRGSQNASSPAEARPHRHPLRTGRRIGPRRTIGQALLVAGTPA